MHDIQSRLRQLQETLPALRLYALVDGVQYQSHQCKRLQTDSGLFSLFADTADATLAHAGPWLIDVASVDEAFIAELATLEREAPAVSWLIAPQDLDGLGQLLQLHLDMQLPDGRSALLRFWDPRVLVTLAQTLDPAQRETFFGHIHEWHLLHEGQRVWIGRHHADAQ
ncbi:DUF4123 domain-containing protein [Denitromonas iodatirespirans]|uniref:DUF4123 domain-containing protein n=1 Tax=Denitromonas iodatirespirans TaxID=2795389 RepID=A0A944H8V4_DENI1|nr:DUF4123 domain-containing protein [Denitromonas iodatirespirans]MBT0962604.1 DUF4123 domain-containing protein [Denitromonas iodatirespirans]